MHWAKRFSSGAQRTSVLQTSIWSAEHAMASSASSSHPDSAAPSSSISQYVSQLTPFQQRCSSASSQSETQSGPHPASPPESPAITAANPSRIFMAGEDTLSA